MQQQIEVEYVTEGNRDEIALSGFICNNCCDSLFLTETEDRRSVRVVKDGWNKNLKGLVSILSGRISQTNTQLNSHLKRSLALPLVRIYKKLDSIDERTSSCDIVFSRFLMVENMITSIDF